MKKEAGGSGAANGRSHENSRLGGGGVQTEKNSDEPFRNNALCLALLPTPPSRDLTREGVGGANLNHGESQKSNKKTTT